MYCVTPLRRYNPTHGGRNTTQTDCNLTRGQFDRSMCMMIGGSATDTVVTTSAIGTIDLLDRACGDGTL